MAPASGSGNDPGIVQLSGSARIFGIKPVQPTFGLMGYPVHTQR